MHDIKHQNQKMPFALRNRHFLCLIAKRLPKAAVYRRDIGVHGVQAFSARLYTVYLILNQILTVLGVQVYRYSSLFQNFTELHILISEFYRLFIVQNQIDRLIKKRCKSLLSAVHSVHLYTLFIFITIVACIEGFSGLVRCTDWCTDLLEGVQTIL